MKNIIIWGCARSGKSTLAKQIKRHYGHNWIATDHIRSFYDGIVPEDKIERQPDWIQAKMMGTAMAGYIKHLCWIAEKEKEYFVIEGVSLDLQTVINWLDCSESHYPNYKGKYVIICIGFPNDTPQRRFELLREYELESDYTKNKDEAELLQDIKHAISHSKKIRDTAKRFGLKFIDFSNREEGIAKALDYINKEMDKKVE